MLPRPFWNTRLTAAWEQAPIVWLTGPRRIGKTVLARSLADTEFLNCDLPSTADRLADPEAFYRSVRASCVVFDEVHQLADPSRLLKIGADEFPTLRILATGSSTLAATQKFRDTLAGRKRVVEMVPVLTQELDAFGVTDVADRLRFGGLPSVLLNPSLGDEFFAEWLDSYFARDVQELFRVEKRNGFLRVLQLLMRQSGGLLDVSRLARESEISRPTVMNWLNVYEVTHSVHVVTPFSGGGRREIIAKPKVFAFDTGFVCHARGWDRLRPDDCGALWEHVVLETLIALALPSVHFWRDKQQREIDFVVPRRGDSVDAIECKWRVKAVDTRSLTAFRGLYPKGRNFIVAPTIREPYERRVNDLPIVFLSASHLATALAVSRRSGRN